ncbi:hypothetical protein [Streptomyces europaeiscabiei]|uniref:hypothetical protein n=1 Tax=Streptomyces europaeiscabiei TaxID=146819 RepID=UPI0029ABAEA3|nr:hypothetical protein [Streptomyces europaeiscabiei]MDX2766443.1 hypothetical protein [Streptomyces europaeiscabiei]
MTTDPQTALRDRIAEALISWTYRGKEPDPETGILETVRANAYSRADAVLAVLPAPADRAAVLREAAEVVRSMDSDYALQEAAEHLDGLAVEADEEREAQAHLDQLAEELAAAIASCPGYEMNPNPCRCPCEGCKHNCGAHDPQPAVGACVAAEAPHTVAPDAHSCGNCDGIDPDSFLTNLDRPAVKAQQAATKTPDEEPGQWCKCRSCWGWFVEEHPGEDLDELGRDLGWWSGLPEHRDAPAVVAQPGKEHGRG